MSIKTNYFCCKNNYFIKYQPELKRFFGSQEAALIFEKSEYWSSKYPSGFWKFHEPCLKHPQYREGDSWEEELGFSRKVFRRAFSAIGIHYKSKSDYLAQSDPFQGKLYASYYDRKTNRTYFLRNHQQVQEFLSSFRQGLKKLAAKIRSKLSQTDSSGNVPLGSSFVRAINNISIQRSTSSCDVILNTPVSSPPEKEPQSASIELEEEKDKNTQVAEDMLKVWNDVTSNQQTLRSNLKVKLPQALTESFQGSLKSWTHFCMKVASSKFLMGEAYNSKFKAYLAWLIKPETVEAIEDEHFSLGDREVHYRPPFDQERETFKREDVQGTENWKDVCEQLNQKIGYATFKSWFRDLKFLNEESTQPMVHCPTRFMRDRIQTHYQSDLERIMRQVLPHVTSLKIEVA